MTIETRNLVKKYWGKTAVDGINLRIEPGQILGLLGPNGAGKSTTIKMLSGQLKPTEGEIIIDGVSMSSVPSDFRGKIGVMPQEVIVWDTMTIKENLLFSAALQKMTNTQTQERMKFLIEGLSLHKELNTLARDLSGGYRRRLNLAISLIHDPEVVFLDEPTPGIDPQSRRFLWDFVQNMRDSEKYSIVLTDHYLDEVERLCDYVVIIDNGSIIAEGTVPELKKKHMEENVVEVTFEEQLDAGLQKRTHEALQQKFKNITVMADTINIYISDGVRAVADVVHILDALKLDPKDISLKEPTLEDIFLKLTGREVRE